MEKSKRRIILVIGPPGVGKGTQSSIIAKKLNWKHISTGDMIREEIKNNSKIGQIVKPFEETGELVPDVLITDIIVEVLSKCTSSVILDGYPRNLDQGLALLSSKNIEIERLLIIQASEDVCLKRLANRNDIGRESKDKDVTFNKGRINFYNNNFKDIFEVFRGKVQVVNGNDDIENVTKNILKLLDQDPSKGNVDFDLLRQEVVIKKIEKNLCICCMSNLADYLIVPCGHQCGCHQCLSTIKQGEAKCPICRKNIENLIKVYRSGIADDEEELKLNSKLNKKTESKVVSKVKNIKSLKVKEDIKGTLKEVKVIDLNAHYDDVKLQEQIVISASLNEDEKTIEKQGFGNVGINISVPDIKVRVPVDVCCVIDVSGSMNDDAVFQDPEDETKTKTDGMSILDLVKHAVKTVINTLTEEDRLSIVSFHTKAKLEYDLHEMTEENKKKAIEYLMKLTALDSTNIWDGLEVGLNSLVKDKHKYKRRKFIALLTDGQPNISPKDGEATALKNYLSKHPESNFQINTFGFGYKLNSAILSDISNIGGGVFGFIPDAKIVGTNFVNFIANAVTTLCLNAKLHIIPLGGSTFTTEISGGYNIDKKNNEKIVKLGNLQFGQSRDLSIPLKLSKEKNYLAAILEYEGYADGVTHKITFIADSREKNKNGVEAYARNKSVSEVKDVIKNYSEGKAVKAAKSLEALCTEMVALDNLAENEYDKLNGLVTDLIGFGGNGGRISKAISTNERFGRWGAHYLRSIVRAHQLELRTNFIDVGLQVYGSETFSNLQDIGGKIFLELEIVKTKVNYDEVYNNNNNNNNNNYNVNNVPAVIDNEDYYGGGGGGCFDERCTVEILKDGIILTKTLNQLEKGDLVKTYNKDLCKNEYAKLICSVKIKLNENDNLIYFKKNGLIITNNHPIFDEHNHKWNKPIDMCKKDQMNIYSIKAGNNRFVINVILEKNHILEVNNVKCVTLGNDFEEIHNEFYGTSKVVKFIKNKFPEDFEKGIVSINGSLRRLSLL